ncbi:hypothetical protein C8R46DRAFT_1042141 [Mycena filopes]|nr:hypothetical protein C8R46DRAFT_1042141 [Mycena filopes]
MDELEVAPFPPGSDTHGIPSESRNDAQLPQTRGSPTPEPLHRDVLIWGVPGTNSKDNLDVGRGTVAIRNSNQIDPRLRIVDGSDSHVLSLRKQIASLDEEIKERGKNNAEQEFVALQTQVTFPVSYQRTGLFTDRPLVGRVGDNGVENPRGNRTCPAHTETRIGRGKSQFLLLFGTGRNHMPSQSEGVKEGVQTGIKVVNDANAHLERTLHQISSETEQVGLNNDSDPSTIQNVRDAVNKELSTMISAFQARLEQQESGEKPRIHQKEQEKELLLLELSSLEAKVSRIQRDMPLRFQEKLDSDLKLRVKLYDESVEQQATAAFDQMTNELRVRTAEYAFKVNDLKTQLQDSKTRVQVLINDRESRMPHIALRTEVDNEADIAPHPPNPSGLIERLNQLKNDRIAEDQINITHEIPSPILSQGALPPRENNPVPRSGQPASYRSHPGVPPVNHRQDQSSQPSSSQQGRVFSHIDPRGPPPQADASFTRPPGNFDSFAPQQYFEPTPAANLRTPRVNFHRTNDDQINITHEIPSPILSQGALPPREDNPVPRSGQPASYRSHPGVPPVNHRQNQSSQPSSSQQGRVFSHIDPRGPPPQADASFTRPPGNFDSFAPQQYFEPTPAANLRTPRVNFHRTNDDQINTTHEIPSPILSQGALPPREDNPVPRSGQPASYRSHPGVPPVNHRQNQSSQPSSSQQGRVFSHIDPRGPPPQADASFTPQQYFEPTPANLRTPRVNFHRTNVDVQDDPLPQAGHPETRAFGSQSAEFETYAGDFYPGELRNDHQFPRGREQEPPAQLARSGEFLVSRRGQNRDKSLNPVKASCRTLPSYSKAVRILMQTLLSITSDRGIGEAVHNGCSTSHEESVAFATNAWGDIQPTLDPFRPCWEDLKGPWNLALEDLFVEHFKSHRPDLSTHEDYIRKHFKQRLETLRGALLTQVKELEQPDLREEEGANRRRCERRRTLFRRRKTWTEDNIKTIIQSDGHDTVMLLFEMVKLLGTEGMSTDESNSDSDKTCTVVSKNWRHPDLVRLLIWIDLNRPKHNVYGDRMSGNPVHRRLRVPYGGSPKSLRRAIANLPINFYDPIWYQGLSNGQKTRLGATAAQPLPTYIMTWPRTSLPSNADDHGDY